MRCSYLIGNIYCLDTSTNLLQDHSNVVINVIDLSNSIGKTAEDMYNKSRPIFTSTEGPPFTPRSHAQTMTLPDKRRVLFSGGWGIDNNSIATQTLCYDAEENSWTKYVNYKEDPFGNRQMLVILLKKKKDVIVSTGY